MSMEEILPSFLLCLLTACIGIAGALLLLLYRATRNFQEISRPDGCVSTIIIFGSGGHTGEMIKLIKNLDKDKYSPLYFLLAHSDVTSKPKIIHSDNSIAERVEWLTIHRSREVCGH